MSNSRQSETTAVHARHVRESKYTLVGHAFLERERLPTTGSSGRVCKSNDRIVQLLFSAVWKTVKENSKLKREESRDSVKDKRK